ncbi:K Homology domain type 1 superfamily [Arabidopsis thaliana x Arabidopsis arenosa]|uniref:K Homology domain type 1 superfamily n=1 Tax=Arabidopsis thaliana x Arabidopsis arenosa TaxID=1240361 RepID=A0A8T2C959_9BRAS|nr:K Homology domain type 1 superfamily [Arabidopsis thaliana x Arabidopsis arenosa]
MAYETNEVREVKVHIACPTVNLRYLLGRNQKNIEKIRGDSNAQISLSPYPGYSCVTVSAQEKFNSVSDSFFAAVFLLPHCRTPLANGGYYVAVLVEENVFNPNWLDPSGKFRINRKSGFLPNSAPHLASVPVSQIGPHYHLQISGTMDEVRHAFCAILHQLRRDVFRLV